MKKADRDKIQRVCTSHMAIDKLILELEAQIVDAGALKARIVKLKRDRSRLTKKIENMAQYL